MGSEKSHFNVLLIVSLWGNIDKTASTNHNFWRKRRAEAELKWGPSAYQKSKCLTPMPNWLIWMDYACDCFFITCHKRRAKAELKWGPSAYQKSKCLTPTPNRLTWIDYVCDCFLLHCQKSSCMLSSDNLSPFLKGGCCNAKSLLWLNSPHVTMQHILTKF